jgi:molecular chaperone GrpE
MSGQPGNPNDAPETETPDPGDSLTAELERTMREAEQSIDASREKSKVGDPGGGKLSADEVTIEALSAELGALKSEYEAKLAELEELKDRGLRQQAEFENFRRRSLKERQEAARYGHQNLVKDLLSTADNLERALEHADGSGGGNLEGLLQGVSLVHREFLAALEKHNVTLVEAEEQAFDPSVHEAVGQVPHAGLPPNSVAHVLQKGYQLHDRMLRPARVMVTRAPEAGEASTSGIEGASAVAGDEEKKE